MRITTAVLVGLGLLLVGCAGPKTDAPAKNTSGMPDFVLNPPKEAGVLFGTGIAEMANPQLAKEAADLRAKKEIANILSQKVSNLMKDFMGQAGGAGKGAEVTEFVQSVTKSISDVELIGCTIDKREYMDGKMYSLARYPLDAAGREAIKNAVNNAFSSKQALLSEFRAKQGFDDLDKALDKMQQEKQ